LVATHTAAPVKVETQSQAEESQQISVLLLLVNRVFGTTTSGLRGEHQPTIE
jgi:hypothetical protein